MTDQFNEGVEPEIRKVDGRSKAARAARAAAPPTRQASRVQNREPAREVGREPARGGAVVVGRDGERLTRKRTGVSDQFDLDQSIWPQGWTYQWNAVSVIGNSDVMLDQNMQMAENGWRPVPASRHPGRFMPDGHKGSIIRGGQRLEERPAALTEEARNEEIAKARQQMSDRNESFNGVRDQMRQGGFEMGRKYRGTGGNIQISIDHGAYFDESGNARSVPLPQHEIAGSGE